MEKLYEKILKEVHANWLMKNTALMPEWTHLCPNRL